MAVETGVVPERYGGARSIGHGGMGEIYVAEDRELRRRVAIKVLDERFADDEHLRRRFKREALAAARLSGHPHVVTIYDVGEWRGRPFIVMEYLEGGTVEQRARSGPIDRREALRWLAQAAEALDAAHEVGIVHRDVKPANLLFDARGDVVVADFGIARAADDTTGMTAAGTVLGTAGYLGPEQALGQPATPASDRYALAVIAYELLTGGRPFERSSVTAEAAAHIHEPVPPASQRGVGLPSSADPVFECALAKDPSARYPSAHGFVQALTTALAGDEQATRTLPVAPAAPPQLPKPPPAPERGRGSRWLPLGLAALVLALIGGVAAAVLTTGNDDGRSAAPVREPREVTVTERVTRTVTGDTVIRTVVETVRAPSTEPPAGASGVTLDEAVRLTDDSTFALRRGDWDEAAKLARRAYPALTGTYSDGFRYEAYVNYDLGKALAELGRCPPALRYLARSEALQGARGEIDDARALCT